MIAVAALVIPALHCLAVGGNMDGSARILPKGVCIGGVIPVFQLAAGKRRRRPLGLSQRGTQQQNQRQKTASPAAESSREAG